MTRDYSKFQLTNAQGEIAPRQPSRLEALGWQPFFAQQITIEALTETPPVRVVSVHRNSQHVVGAEIDKILPPIANTTVGDWIMLDPNQPQSSTVLERKSIVKRRAPGLDRKAQLIAANLETAFIVTSCNRDFNVARLERYIALALESEITPVIVLTKMDLVDDVDGFVAQAQSISDLVPVVALNAKGDDVLQKLSAWCTQGKTVAFLGSSGVGKSTLTNALMGTDDIETQSIREADARGRHTTTHRELHLTPSGCLVLDTPGMRELQLTDVSAGIADLFSDLDDIAKGCRFRDCLHDSEPGCAVTAAVADGTLNADRVQRWRKLLAEEAFNNASLSERRANDKDFGKMVRRAVKAKTKGRRHK